MAHKTAVWREASELTKDSDLAYYFGSYQEAVSKAGTAVAEAWQRVQLLSQEGKASGTDGHSTRSGNVSGKDRVAILNAVTPRYIVPMIDMTNDLENAVQASQAGKWEEYLTVRERKEMDAMLSRNHYKVSASL